jgi:hypothetical protein
MITKRQIIETIQNRLASGDVTDDLRGKYPYQVIAYVLNLAYTDAVYNNPNAKKDLSVRYSANVSCNHGEYSAKLPVLPLLGSEGITYVEGSNCVWYPIRVGSTENRIMNMIKPQTDKITCYIRSSKIYFNEKPTDVVYLDIIPNVAEMGDDDVISLPGQEANLYNMVIQMIMQTNTRPEEVYNNAVPDTEKPTNPAR